MSSDSANCLRFIDSEQRVEEKELPDYKADWFYSVELGQVFQGRYQILAKFSFGSSSTSWLARDLDSRQARRNVRSLHDSFEIQGPDGSHVVLVLEPAQMSLRDMKTVFRPEGFDEDMVKCAIIELLKALDFLHTQAKIVHTDIHPGNMLLGAYDNEIFMELEEAESRFPVPRKRGGPMLLSDYDEARIGHGPHGGDIMPLEYRAPETLLYVGWSYPVDIWSVGLTAWDLLRNKRLFTARKWLGLAPFREGRTLESLETKLKDKTGFLRFIRRALTWLPEERATAKELLQDPWLAC
ncbi:kinase-like domain-containing protein [Aspergillus keveii]|uniref:non-specific serine/threonine protein kinase n=1 Tax=Aspergillus keveii TaxID=714993 RepID=A0ABR4G2L6_9EURO